MSALVLGAILLCGRNVEETDPFAHVVNVLYNPQFLPASVLAHDPYAGAAPAPAEPHLPPGWFPDPGTRAALDTTVFAVPPRSLRIESGPGTRAVVSYPLSLGRPTFVIARAKVMAEGNPGGARLALRWYMADGSMRRSPSEPPGKERDFVQVLVSARPPEGARAVALVLEASDTVGSCRFDEPILAMIAPDIVVTTFPAGCHPRGLREAVVATRFPFARPAARVTWGDQGKSIEVHPLSAHASGCIYYALDLSLFEAPGDYAIEVRDEAIEGREGRAHVVISTDPYAALATKAAAYVLAHWTTARVRQDALRTAAENIVLLSYAPATQVRSRLAEVAGALEERLRDAKDLDTEAAAPCAWALARAAYATGNAALAARARALLYAVMEGGATRSTAERAALCGAASALALRNENPLDRDYADDAASELVASQRPGGAFPFSAAVAEQHWPVFALADYAHRFPDSSVTPKAQSALDGCVGRIERLCVSTPFGNVRAVDAEERETDIPAWPHGNTLYLLSQAAALCAHSGADFADRLRIHAERQTQFLLGFNPLGKALDLEKGESLRSSAGERLRPGEVLLAEPVDPLRVHLYLWYVTAALRDGLAEAERLFQEYERARKEKASTRK